MKNYQLSFNTFVTLVATGLVTYAIYMTKHEFERISTQMAIKSEVDIQILSLRERMSTLEYRINNNEHFNR